MAFLDVPFSAASYLDLPGVQVITVQVPGPPVVPDQPDPGQGDGVVVIRRTPDAGVIPPAFRVEYGSTQAGQNRLHVLANGGIDATLYPAGLAAGTLTLLYGSMADALTCRAAHAALGIFELEDGTLPAASMRYVVAPGDGALQLAKADQVDDGTVWQLSIAYQEVP